MTSKAICILGMHRSGTSAITRAVNLLGAFLGEDGDLMAPAPDNPEGFWERNDIVSLNDKVLLELQRTWDCTLPLPDDWHKGEQTRSLKAEIRSLVENKLAIHPLWAWKDPRSCLLLPLWKEVLDELGVELTCIFVSRNPLDVAQSLQKRNAFSFSKSLGIWFNYNLSALKAAKEIPTLFLSYDEALDGGAEGLVASLEGLRIIWPTSDSRCLTEMQSFLRPNLRHSCSALKDLAAAPAPIRELYDVITGTICHGGSGNLPAGEHLEVLSHVFSDFSSFFREDVVGSWNLKQEHLRTACDPETLAQLQQQLADRTAWALSLDDQLRARNRRIVALQDEVQDRTAWALKLRDDLEARESLVVALQTELQERTDWAVKLKDDLEARDSRVIALQAQLEERTDWAVKLKDDLEARDSRVIALQAQLEERTDWALKLNSDLEVRNSNLAALQKEFDARTSWALALKQNVEQRDDLVCSLQQALEEQTASALLREKNIGDRDARISALEASAAKLESDARDNQAVIETQRTHIAKLKSDLDETSEELTRLKAEVLQLSTLLKEEESVREEVARKHRAATGSLEAELARKDAAIEELLSSWSWRVTAPLRAVYTVLKQKK